MNRSRARAVVLAVIIMSLAAACGGSDSDGGAGAESAPAPAPELGAGGGGAGGGGARGGSSGQGVTYDREGTTLGRSSDRFAGSTSGLGGSSVLPGVGPRVIKTAELELEVDEDNFQAAIRRATSIAQGSRGFVVETIIDDRSDGRGSIQLRVPSEQFEGTLAKLQGLGKVKRETVSGDEVNEEFIDLEARLRHMTAQERVLLRLMDRATSISGTIRVQRELEGLQLQIEQLRGRLRFLENQTAFGTIHMVITEVQGPPPRVSKLENAWEDAVDIFLSIVAAAILGISVLLPLALAIVAIVFAINRLKPRFGSGFGGGIE